MSSGISMVVGYQLLVVSKKAVSGQQSASGNGTSGGKVTGNELPYYKRALVTIGKCKAKTNCALVAQFGNPSYRWWSAVSNGGKVTGNELPYYKRALVTIGKCKTKTNCALVAQFGNPSYKRWERKCDTECQRG